MLGRRTADGGGDRRRRRALRRSSSASTLDRRASRYSALERSRDNRPPHRSDVTCSERARQAHGEPVRLLGRLAQAGVEAPAADPAFRRPDVDEGAGRSRAGLSRDEAADAGPRPPHGVRGSGLPQHLRMLGRPHRHVHDHGRALHRGRAASALSTPAIRSRSTRGSRRASPTRLCNSGLEHAVVTSVARDDLADGGAEHFAAHDRRDPRACRRARRSRCSSPTARATPTSLDVILAARPDVVNHNLETVARLRTRRAAVGRLRPVAHGARPSARRRLHREVGAHRRAGRDRCRGARGDHRPPQRRRRVLTVGQYLRPSPCARAGGAVVDARRVRRVARLCPRPRVRARGVRPARALELPRQARGGAGDRDARSRPCTAVSA